MGRSTSLALAFVFFFGGALLAEAEPAAGKKPLGTWKRTVGDATLTFEFKTDNLHCILSAGGNTIEMDADYGMSKDGVLFGRISKVEKKGTNDGPSEGELFSFKVSVENETLMLSELKTHNDSADAKQLLEGEYQKQK
jgi:hypothetical protein